MAGKPKRGNGLDRDGKPKHPGWGGARPGSGRKPANGLISKKLAETIAETLGAPAESETRDPLEFLLDVMQGKLQAKPTQVRAAIAAAQYKHVKRAQGGQRDEQMSKAKGAAARKFSPAAAPLKLVGR